VQPSQKERAIGPVRCKKEGIMIFNGGSRPGVWGGSQIGARQKCLHLLKYQRLPATIVVCHTKEVTICRSKSGYFCWANYAIFQGITTV